MKTRTLSLLLAVCTALGCLWGCSSVENDTAVKPETDASSAVTEGAPPLDLPSRDYAEPSYAACDFALRLLRASGQEGENTLVSPLSVMCALAMTANGAEDETRTQMEGVLGMKAEELNAFLSAYLDTLPEGEKYKLRLANSVWFTDDGRFSVNGQFLETVDEYYGADVYSAPFNDETCRRINGWVNESTDGMIPEILDRIPEDAVMYLINALAFDAEWADKYSEDQVLDGIFTAADGSKQTAEFLHGTEHSYLEDEGAVGFIKPYSGGKYAFVALLPKEGASVSDYIASLDGERLSVLLSSPQSKTVHTSMPKLELEYSAEMAEILSAMGMPRAFDFNSAQFAGLGTSTRGNIYINRVLHKTYISVGEQGTRAGAATLIQAADSAAPTEKPKEVDLDRPFVFMLIDCENDLPFFIGTVNSLGE